MKFLLKILLTALNVFLLASVLPGVSINHFFTAILAALVLAILNSFVKPVLVLLTLPVSILTLGLFLCVINACIILTGAYFIKGFTVDGFWHALLFSICLSCLNLAVHKLVKKEEGRNYEL